MFVDGVMQLGVVSKAVVANCSEQFEYLSFSYSAVDAGVMLSNFKCQSSGDL
jgi:hypothetical protein